MVWHNVLMPNKAPVASNSKKSDNTPEVNPSVDLEKPEVVNFNSDQEAASSDPKIETPTDSKTANTPKQNDEESPDTPLTSQKAQSIISELTSEEDLATDEKPRRRFPLWAKIVLGVFLFILVIILAIAAYVYFVILPPARSAYQAVSRMQVNAGAVQDSFKAKDLATAKSKLADIQADIDIYKQSINDLSQLKRLPQLEPYWSDANNVGNAAEVLLEAGAEGFEAITPYADLFGMSTDTEESEEATQTASDRIDFLVTTIDKIVPQLEGIGEDIKEAEGYLSQIDPNRYPQRLDEGILAYIFPPERQNIEVRSQIIQAQSLISQASILLNDAKPLLDVAPYLLGADAPRTYLMLFQNDAEMRPTGGFLTAYAIIRVDKGRITPVLNTDIYDLDARYTGRDPAPQVLIDYIADPYAKEKLAGQTPVWRLRDRNLSPDFKQSMEDFAAGYAQTRSPEYDGIIGVDTKFLVALLEVIGPIGVGGYGNFSTEIVPECDCPQIIYELEAAISYETPYIRENRKAILGSVMYSILSNAFAQPKEKVPDLADAVFKAIQQKNVMMYFPDEELQSAVESFNMAGRVRESQGDYLMVVDANLGGRKANLFIDQELELDVQTNDSGTQNTLTIKYRNPRPKDKWLNDDAPTWVRVYAPAGSKLVDSKGSELQVTTSEDLDKTVFSAFFVLRTQGVHTLTFTYETPTTTEPYQLLVQKQGGTKNHPLNITVNGLGQQLELDGDKQLTFN